MKTAVTDTSIEAYRSLDLNSQQQEVLTALKVLGESCIADLAAYLNWDKSTVSGRLNDLKKMSPCPITKVGKKKSQTTKINSEFWRPAEFKESLF